MSNKKDTSITDALFPSTEGLGKSMEHSAKTGIVAFLVVGLLDIIFRIIFTSIAGSFSIVYYTLKYGIQKIYKDNVVFQKQEICNAFRTFWYTHYAMDAFVKDPEFDKKADPKKFSAGKGDRMVKIMTTIENQAQDMIQKLPAMTPEERDSVITGLKERVANMEKEIKESLHKFTPEDAEKVMAQLSKVVQLAATLNSGGAAQNFSTIW